VMIIGFLAAFRLPALRAYRWLSLGFGLTAIVVVLTGGKPYYVSGLFSVGLALSTWPVVAVLDPGRWRRVIAGAVLGAVSLGVAVLSLPIAPIGTLPFRMAATVNPDTAETVGWNLLVDVTADAVATIPADDRADTVIIARNYGEAGALIRARRLGFGRASDTGTANRGGSLPPVFAGHNAFYGWGPPPPGTRTVVVVGEVDPVLLKASFAQCAPAGIVHSPPGVDNEEDGAVVQICRNPTTLWPELWPRWRRYG
jgi:hypothetical protein